MHQDLIDLGWTDEQWNRIRGTITEEAQRARVAARVLPVAGPLDPSTVAVPNFTLDHQTHPTTSPPPERLWVDSDPTLYLTTIAVNVEVRTTDAADPDLAGALVMFRRAANHIARIEDALVFNGRATRDVPPPAGLAGVPPVYKVTGHSSVPGIFRSHGWRPNRRIRIEVDPPTGDLDLGHQLVSAVERAISQLERRGQLGPYACFLGEMFFDAVCHPNESLVLPRDRILPFLEGPLVRSSAFKRSLGAVIALGGNPIEIVVASDIDVRYLQTSLEPRFIFRVSERVAVRIKESAAIAILRPARPHP